MRKNSKFGLCSALLLGASLALSACQTIPYPERLAAFENQMKDRFVGKSVDQLILAFGPPESSYTLSDGRDVVQYKDERTITSGGDSYTSFETASRVRVVRDKNGNPQRIVETYHVPTTNISPVYTSHQKCAKRFIVSKQKIVEGFAWEGNSCF